MTEEQLQEAAEIRLGVQRASVERQLEKVKDYDPEHQKLAYDALKRELSLIDYMVRLNRAKKKFKNK